MPTGGRSRSYSRSKKGGKAKRSKSKAGKKRRGKRH
jgi:hypothetical protein